MASITQSPEILDNHKESWLVLLSAAEAYCQKSGCDLAIITASKTFRPSAGDGDGLRKRESSSSSAFPKECDFSYNVWGQGFLAESARRYMDDIAVLHSTTMLTAQKHTRQAGGEGGTKLVVDLTSDPGHRGVSGLLQLYCCTNLKTVRVWFSAVVAELYSGRWRGWRQPQWQAVLPKLPVNLQCRSWYRAGCRAERREGPGEKHPGSRAGETQAWDCVFGRVWRWGRRRRSGREETLREWKRWCGATQSVLFFKCFDGHQLWVFLSFCASGVFSMDEDSLSRDCEPFFESDGEEESTDGIRLL